MRLLLGALLSLAVAGPATAEVPNVVATIKPIHSLVAAVMGELGEPALIVKGAASPHTYSLRPSDAAALEQADVVFWTGHGMELFLEDAIDTLAPNAAIVELSDTPGIELLPLREGGAFEPHADGEHTGDAHESERDVHFWLDPANGALMLQAIAEALATADPEHADIFRSNAATEGDELTMLTAAIDRQLAPVRDRPFIVFHDAYQYFERRFGLAVTGSLTVTPDTAPGAQRVTELRDKVMHAGAVCVFVEPQFEPAIVATVIEGTAARSGVLDPEGANLEPGPGLYAALVRGLADSLADCLAG